MKILFFGDSITDAGRSRDRRGNARYGYGYVMQIVGRLFESEPMKHEIINSGIAGDRTVDMYARIKADVWNFKPDVLSILAGVNDACLDVIHHNGVELDRFERIYRMIIEDTVKALPDTKIIICEPFLGRGSETDARYDELREEVSKYAKAIRRIANDLSIPFVPLWEKISEATERHGEGSMLYDGVHPSVEGATLIANEWLKAYRSLI